MHKKAHLYEKAPVSAEERNKIIDSMQYHLRQPTSEVDAQWATVARHRLTDIRSGATESIPGQAVFDKLWKRFEQ